MIPNVLFTSYLCNINDPIIIAILDKWKLKNPEEGKHFIRCNNPKDLKEILSKITEEEWEVMSKNCYEWYQKNVYSKNSFKHFLNKILYN